MSLDLSKIKIDKEKVGFFRFKKLEDFFILTNDVAWINLKEDSFKDFLEGKLDENSVIYQELASKGFIKNRLPLNNIVNTYRKKSGFLYKEGTSLHIIVVTKRCNHLCVYCQAGSPELQDPIYDMTEETAKKTVDLIFQGNNPFITIEFQGGEPLINWKVVKFIISYVKEKEKTSNKHVHLGVSTNLSLMTDEIFEFLFHNNVSISTSLDGPEHIHNKNRPYNISEGSYKKVVYWIEKIKNYTKKECRGSNVGALPTLTKYSLEHIEEIVDEYIKQGNMSIHFRQLSYLGNSSGEKSRQEFGYTAEEFISGWKRGMDYIIQKNKEGFLIRERMAITILARILTDRAVSYLDFRSPCGLGIGMLSYFYDGTVYTCEVGRLIGDDTFLLGTVNDSYEKIMEKSRMKSFVGASILDASPCNECVYKPYCGICPASNYALSGNFFPNMRMMDKCKIAEAQIDYLFLKIQDKQVLDIFKKWLERSKNN
ncbi:MAG: His-Xaa-Ser system radical SAM maturase HxsB [Clostridia bacterium]|nr:His-Xaa-Ser system radical SAM maturase HxsB [Clostridia bacterium]